MPRPIQCLIHKSAIAHNLALAIAHAGSGVVYAVIKADAYGHGIDAIYPALQFAHGIALLEIEAAVRLRQQGETRPILLLEGVFDVADVRLAREHDLSVVLHDPAQLAWLDAAPGSALQVFVKINTGMNRLGMTAQALQQFLPLLQARHDVRDIVLMTHFASADEAAGITSQKSVFNEMASSAGFVGKTSLANSAATWRAAEAGGDVFRAGIMLYGGSPQAGVDGAQLGLKAAMSLRANIIACQQISAGEAVGYGASFRAIAPMRIGVVACGYADGYPRSAPTGTPVWVRGQRVPLVGRVSMDMLTIDLTNVEAGVGDEVELWGECLPIDVVARAAGTISYELMCGITARVPKKILEN